MNTFNTSKSNLLNFPRTIHFLLKPVESGVDDYNILPPPVHLFDNLSLIPGRITLSQFESILVDRWSMNPDENVLSVRTMTQIEQLRHDIQINLTTNMYLLMYLQFRIVKSCCSYIL